MDVLHDRRAPHAMEHKPPLTMKSEHPAAPCTTANPEWKLQMIFMRFDITNDGTWDYNDYNEYRRGLGLRVLPHAAIAAEWKYKKYDSDVHNFITYNGLAHFYRTGPTGAGRDLEEDFVTLTKLGSLKSPEAFMLSIDCRAGRHCAAAVKIVNCESHHQVTVTNAAKEGNMMDHDHLFEAVDHDMTDANSRVHLHYAAHNDDADAVEALIRSGASPNVCDSRGFTPLAYVASPMHGNKGPDVHSGTFTKTMMLHHGGMVKNPSEHGEERPWFGDLPRREIRQLE